MKTLLVTILLAVTTQAFAFTMPEMPSNSDFEATETYAYNKAVDTAEMFAASKGYSSVSVVALEGKPFDVVAKYQATAGSCQFMVKVGLFFKAKVANVQNCSNQ